MTFESRFESADGFLNHTDVIMEGIDDPLIQQKYLGFIAISAVTVYELAIKDIIFRFSDSEAQSFGFVIPVFFRKDEWEN